MIEGTHGVDVVDSVLPSNDASALTSLVPTDDGELPTAQELLVVQVRVPCANRRLDDGQIGVIRHFGCLVEKLVDARNGNRRQHAQNGDDDYQFDQSETFLRSQQDFSCSVPRTDYFLRLKSPF